MNQFFPIKPAFGLSKLATGLFKAFSTLGLTVLASAAVANSAADNRDDLEVITVGATKTSRNINEIAANVTRITAQDIDAIGATTIRDILRYEPGVSVEGGGRFGLSDFNIRGINGDRVLILLDGIPVADEFSFGPNLSSRRDFIDIDLIQNVEIIRGPASTLYGSDAIGGVIAFTSKQPKDLVSGTNDYSVRSKLGYASASEQYNANIQAAGIQQQWQWLVDVGYRKGHETESFYTDDTIGADRKSSDPQDTDSQNVLAKLIYSLDSTANSTETVNLTADFGTQNRDTKLLSAQNVASRGAITLSSLGIDESTRSRVSLQYNYQNPDSLVQKLDVLGFVQRSETAQRTEIQRASLADITTLQDRLRDSEFNQDIIGLHIQADQQFELAGSHYLIYGLQWEQTDSESLRTGETRIAASGDIVPEFSVFPARDFPLSELTEISVFVQDEISLLNDTLRLSPGIRYDRFELVPEQDPIFANANPGVEISDYKDSEFSLKLGAIYAINQYSNVWWQYSEGFRIPPMDDVNVGFTNFAGGYTSLPNPNLKPETVVSNEIGYRLGAKAIDFSISAYDNRYKNFIESLNAIGFNPVTNLLEFQAINIDDVKIQGVDVQLQWYLGESFTTLQDWQLRFATSWQQSENIATGQELESVLPAQSVVGIQYRTADDPWSIELMATHTEKSNTFENSVDGSEFFAAPSYLTWDLLAHYTISESARINAGLFNLTDEKYWLSSETRGRSSDDDLSRFTAPGRNFSINLVLSF